MKSNSSKRPPSAKKFILKKSSDGTKKDTRTKSSGLKVKKAGNQSQGLKVKKAGNQSQGLKVKKAGNQSQGLTIKKAGNTSSAPTEAPAPRSAGNNTAPMENKNLTPGLKMKKAGGQTHSPGLRMKRPGGQTQAPGLKIKTAGTATQSVGLQIKQPSKAESTTNASGIQVPNAEPEELRSKPAGNMSLMNHAQKAAPQASEADKAATPPPGEFHARPPSLSGLFGNVKSAKSAKPAKTIQPQTEPTRQETPTISLQEPGAPSFSASSSTNEYKDSRGTTFCNVPAGTYLVGPENEPISIPVAFGIAKLQVSKAEFFTFLTETENTFTVDELNAVNSISPYPNCPMINVSWEDAKNFCRWLRHKTGEYYNLPSSNEWEAAARGQDGRHYPWGDTEPTLDIALFNDGVHEPLSCSAVDYYTANASPLGVLGLIGNAMEWTNDSFDDERDPHILKGGSWRSPVDFCNTYSSVLSFPSTRREDYFGLRVIHVTPDAFKDYYMANMT